MNHDNGEVRAGSELLLFLNVLALSGYVCVSKVWMTQIHSEWDTEIKPHYTPLHGAPCHFICPSVSMYTLPIPGATYKAFSFLAYFYVNHCENWLSFKLTPTGKDSNARLQKNWMSTCKQRFPDEIYTVTTEFSSKITLSNVKSVQEAGQM